MVFSKYIIRDRRSTLIKQLSNACDKEYLGLNILHIMQKSDSFEVAFCSP